jgi:hypothetical protein
MATTPRKTKSIREFGDFQTPRDLAAAAVQLLHRLAIEPKSVLEPTCGVGAFVSAAAAAFPNARSIVGYDINNDYLASATANIADSGNRIVLRHGDFFSVDWLKVVTCGCGPWLIVGNPPWVTSAELGSIDSDNLPAKSNFHGRMGIEAITGKSNFDISEWMLLRYLDWLEGEKGTIAVLCKTAVARKILLYIWKKKLPLRSARIFKIDAQANFGAAVDACFFVLELEPGVHAQSCDIFDSLGAARPTHTAGFHDGHLINDVPAFNRHRHLLGPEAHYVWRSGVKHDCSKVMELMTTPNGIQNGLGETVVLEDVLTYPFLKSSDIGNGRIRSRGLMIVTQKTVGADTANIESEAPRTWEYLQRHASLLDKRGSVVYKNKPAFSVFGVGPYTFSPWKIAISGFYKKLLFVKIGPVTGRPMVFDDTIYFLPCWSKEEADFLADLLDAEPVRAFFQSMINWDEKRPITVEILKRLNLRKVAESLGKEDLYLRFAKRLEAVSDTKIAEDNTQIPVALERRADC